MTLGVLGAGLFANATLLPAIRKIKDIELVGIASAGGLHAQHSARKFGFAYATSNDDEILNDPDINTVAILTRHDTHCRSGGQGFAGRQTCLCRKTAGDKR